MTLSLTPLGKFDQSGFQLTSNTLEAPCHNKVFYISGIKTTKRKTNVRGQGGSSFKNMAAPCAGYPRTSMEVIFKGSSTEWPELFNKKFSFPIQNIYKTTYYIDDSVTPPVTKTCLFYLPYNGNVSYFDPNRKFYFKIDNIGVCIPKEFFNSKETRVYNDISYSYWQPFIVTQNNQHLLEVTKKTPTTFFFKNFEFNNELSYCFSNHSSYFTYPTYYNYRNQSFMAYDGWGVCPPDFVPDPWNYNQCKTQEGFDDSYLGIPPATDFLLSDYCFEIYEGSLLFKHINIVPANPELSEILGIESINIRLTNAQ